jgi:CheY-like chemotaxis protein
MATTNHTKTSSAPGSRSMLRVLLVDDDDFQIDAITEILRGLGVRDIACASSGTEALQKLAPRDSGYHLIVLDLHMPGMDGFQFMESIAHGGYAGALIIVSGQSQDVLHAASLVARLRRFTLLGAVAKPVGRSALSDLLSKWGC